MTFRHDSASQRAKSLKSPWRKGPIVRSPNAQKAFVAYKSRTASGPVRRPPV